MKKHLNTLLISIALAGCGGGGGESPASAPSPAAPTQYSAISTCWDGLRPISLFSQSDANSKVPSQCSAIGANTVSISNTTQTLTGLPAGATISSGNLIAVNGSASKALTINSTGQLVSTACGGAFQLFCNTQYTYTNATISFSNAPLLTFSGSFVTSNLICPAGTNAPSGSTVLTACVTAPQPPPLQTLGQVVVGGSSSFAACNSAILLNTTDSISMMWTGCNNYQTLRSYFFWGGNSSTTPAHIQTMYNSETGNTFNRDCSDSNFTCQNMIGITINRQLRTVTFANARIPLFNSTSSQSAPLEVYLTGTLRY